MAKPPYHTAHQWPRGWATLICLTMILACGEDTATATTGTIDAGKTDAATTPDVVEASCVGVASASRQLFAQYDDQCEFLKDCPTSGKCYCGDGCSTSKTKCATALCTSVDSDCWCGKECDSQTDKTQCPEYVCKDLKITGCEKQAGCKYVGQEMADKCKCNTMPDTAPPCFCGTTCSTDKTACVPAKCIGKNPKKCILVPGAKHTTPYCRLCGLLGTQPKCFFVISP
ncbi:MAG: hypothetical protein KC502_10260 [Myxococcales bacterium]|nr:hypothetical protein [Myxococcales bacterium]